MAQAMQQDIFEAARSGELDAVKSWLQQGADLAARNKYGFTALHCAVMGCDAAGERAALAVIELLLKAGSSVEEMSSDGRTPLFLAAEFSSTVEPLKMLIQAGAKADVRDSHGNHIVTNALTKEAQEFLATVTGHPIELPRPKSVKMTSAEWRSAKIQIDNIFEELSMAGLVTLQDAGLTQEDGFSDCSERFRILGGSHAGLWGFCFYTRQDLNRAKRTSQLTLAIWGAPDGNPEAMLRAGQLVEERFRKAGFTVVWDGSPSHAANYLFAGKRLALNARTNRRRDTPFTMKTPQITMDDIYRRENEKNFEINTRFMANSLSEFLNGLVPGEDD
jgi:hypothetical protein